MSIQPTQPSAAEAAIEGELSIDELEQIAGGLGMEAMAGPEAFTSTFSMPGDLPVHANKDSSQTTASALGTNGNESSYIGGTVMNVTPGFP